MLKQIILKMGQIPVIWNQKMPLGKELLRNGQSAPVA